MSFLLRLAARAGRMPDPAPLARPKGLPGPLARQTEPDEEDTLQPLRQDTAEPTDEALAPQRASATAEEDDAAPMRRAAAPTSDPALEDEGEDAAPDRLAPPRRAAAPTSDSALEGEGEDAAPDGLAPLRRAEAPVVGHDDSLDRAVAVDAEDDEPLAMLRRAADYQAEEEAMRVLARSAAPEDDGETESAAPLRRVAPPPDAGLEPESAPRAPGLGAEPEPRDARALRRDLAGIGTREAAGFSAAAVTDAAAGEAAHPADEAAWLPAAPPSWRVDAGTGVQENAGGDWRESWRPEPTEAATRERPQVVIEHLDVVVREAASPAGGSVSGGGAATRRGDSARGLRARYLGGL